MKKHVLRLVGALGVACLAASCATAYDAQGRQVQVVTPEGAAATAVVAGLIGYAVAKDNRKKHYRPRGYHSGYGGYGGYGGYHHGGYCR
jgi:hypothetical protein